MMEFFRNNFAEDRWRRAALKNAFALLGRQRFVHAAAFFLLAGALRDAIEVGILNSLNRVSTNLENREIREMSLKIITDGKVREKSGKCMKICQS